MNAFFRYFANAFSGFFDKRLWTPTIGGSRSTVAHEDVSEDTALNYSAVWCATRLLCGTGASFPLPVYTGRDKDSRSKDRTHPVYRVLNGKPNAEQTAYNFRSVMWQWQVNWGNAYAEIVREGNNPLAPLMSLHPIHPSRVSIKRFADGSLYYEVYNWAEEPSLLDPWQMLHVPSIITHDGTTGHGVIAHARECIGAGIAAEKYGAHFFGGGGMPTVVVEHAGNWNPEARKAFGEEWEAIHSGATGKKVAVLQGGAKANPLSLNAEDMQFIEMKNFGVEEIARWYGIPPHLLQHLLRATFNNIEELGINFVQYSLVPWLRIWEQCIWQKLFTEEEQDSYFAEHNVDALLRGNAAARASFYQSMTSSALMTRNECRKLENLDPVDGGDTFLVQGAMVPLDDGGKPESKFVNGGEPAQPASEVEGETTDNEKPAEEIMSRVSGHLCRSAERKLRWVLTKETKSIAKCAKNPQLFATLVSEFYAEHAETMKEEFGDTISALDACGRTVAVDEFVGEWVREGKTLVMEAAEKDDPQAVASVLKSAEWSQRPARAVERVEHATLVV